MHVPDDDDFGTEAHELLERYLGIRDEAAQGRMEDLERVMAPSNPFLPLGAPLLDDDYPLKPIGFVGADEFDGAAEKYPPLRVVEMQNSGFPIRFSSTVFQFPRQTGKNGLREIAEKVNAGQELTPEEYARANEVFRHFAEAMRPVIKQVAETLRGLADIVQRAKFDNPDLFSESPVHPKDVRDERGIKRPSTRPPMWANDPTKGRRRR